MSNMTYEHEHDYNLTPRTNMTPEAIAEAAHRVADLIYNYGICTPTLDELNALSALLEE